MIRVMPFMLLICTSALLLQESQAAPNKIPLIVTDPTLQFAPGTFPGKLKWQSLECNGSGCEIKATNVRIVKTKVEHLGDELVPIHQPKSKRPAHALFANGNYPLGKVTTWFHSSLPNQNKYDFINSPQVKAVHSKTGWRFPGDATTLTLTATRIVTKYPDGEGLHTRYQINEGKRVQELFIVKEDEQEGSGLAPMVHWVGDMDKDGKIDFIMDVPHDGCGYDMRLYLSSKAGPHEIVGVSAQLDGFQEACGC